MNNKTQSCSNKDVRALSIKPMFKHTHTRMHRKPLTEVFQQIFAVVSRDVMDSAMTLVPPLNVLLAVTAQHLQTLLHTQTTITQ